MAVATVDAALDAGPVWAASSIEAPFASRAGSESAKPVENTTCQKCRYPVPEGPIGSAPSATRQREFKTHEDKKKKKEIYFYS